MKWGCPLVLHVGRKLHLLCMFSADLYINAPLRKFHQNFQIKISYLRIGVGTNSIKRKHFQNYYSIQSIYGRTCIVCVRKSEREREIECVCELVIGWLGVCIDGSRAVYRIRLNSRGPQMNRFLSLSLSCSISFA